MADRYDITIIGSGIGAWPPRSRSPRSTPASARIPRKNRTSPRTRTATTRASPPPHLLQARLVQGAPCVEGKALMRQFCEKHAIKVVDCGKVIVATTPDELPRLHTLHERAQANGVPVEMIEPERLREIEPHAAGIRAIWSPTTAIVDYIEVAEAMARDLRQRGVEIETSAGVTNIARTSDASTSGRRAGRCSPGASSTARDSIPTWSRAWRSDAGRSDRALRARILHGAAGPPSSRAHAHLPRARS